MSARVRRQDLGQLVELARGGAGVVHRLPGFRLPGYAGEVVFKEPLDRLDAIERAKMLTSMERTIQFRESLGVRDRAELDEYTAWPLAMVEDQGRPAGVLLPLLPHDFFLVTNPIGGEPGELVFELSWLCAKDTQAQRLGIDRSGIRDQTVRLALLARLAYIIAILHRHDLVYGDLSLKNAALALDPIRLKLLDCDGIASAADESRSQPHTASFRPPEFEQQGGQRQTSSSDVYKLALCVVRGLQQGPGATQASDPEALRGLLDDDAADLLSRAITGSPADRPAARDLFRALERNIFARVSPPQVAASLSRSLMVRGQDLQVRWNVIGADSMRIIGPGGLNEPIFDPKRRAGERVVRPLAAGEITIEATNRHGTVRVPAGTVDLYELPVFRVQDVSLPRAAVPGLPPFRMPVALSELPARPLVAPGGLSLPELEIPSMLGAIEAISPVMGTPFPLTRPDDGPLAGARSVRASLMRELEPGMASSATAAGRARRLVDDALDQFAPLLHQQALAATAQPDDLEKGA